MDYLETSQAKTRKLVKKQQEEVQHVTIPQNLPERDQQDYITVANAKRANVTPAKINTPDTVSGQKFKLTTKLVGTDRWDTLRGVWERATVNRKHPVPRSSSTREIALYHCQQHGRWLTRAYGWVGVMFVDKKRKINCKKPPYLHIGRSIDWMFMLLGCYSPG